MENNKNLKNAKNYIIGLDIGTDSVGWAVVESGNQKILRKGNKALWGVRLFDSASSAEERRNARSTRRRYDRRRERINLLQEEFKEEILKVDFDFFTKLKESKYTEDDIKNKTVKISENERKLASEYFKKYPTIYHLRKKLIENDEKEDIRLVYLAIHHMIKYRGNFLYKSNNFNVNNIDIDDKLNQVFTSYFSYINAEYEEFGELLDIGKLKDALNLQLKSDIKVEVKNVLNESGLFEKGFIDEFVKMILGNQFEIKKLLSLEETDNKLKICFDGDYLDNEEKYNIIEDICGDRIEILLLMKELYDALFLKRLFKGSSETNISSLMVKKYNQHKDDLKFLKSILKNNKDVYKNFFKKDCIYKKYVTNNKTYEEFIKEVDKAIANIDITDYNLSNKYITEIRTKMDNGDFMPRITSTENGKYPYQLNRDELIKIIENQGKYYPFLLNKTEDGVYKIVKLLEFRIPYYVGPLVSDKKSKFAWMERNIENTKITPYNFDKVVNKELTAEKFIKRMVSDCTYLIKEPALPNNSLIYNYFKVLNELKQIRINGDLLELKLQHKIIEELFKNTKGTITEKKFKDFLLSNNEFPMYGTQLNITGYSADGAFANNMQSYNDFFGENGIFEGTSYNEKDAENIIEWITIFEDKDILKDKVIKNYPKLNNEKVKSILNKKYKGWGKLSLKLLTTKYYLSKETNTKKSILELMYETKENFMQIINNEEYNFDKMINDINNEKLETNKTDELDYSIIEPLATSPANKRGIYQALKIVGEIVNYIGYDPEYISVEMARSDDKKVRKDNKKKYIENLYEKSRDQIEDYNKLQAQLKKEEINSEKMFLYFIQEGKCLYSGKPLDIEDLSLYEVDHIIPRTLIKDDSIDNKALVYKECNQNKAASYVLPKEYRSCPNKTWWKHLRKIGLMSAKKFHNLIREKYSDEDIEGFINRQLVETRQITKHVANILNYYYKNTKIIYPKAKLSHDYRNKYELYKFREINDYHHAHDAYLAAVLGEYKEKYLRRNVNFQVVKELNYLLRSSDNKDAIKYGYVINSLDENVNGLLVNLSNKYVDKKTGELLFNAHEFNKRIEDTLYRNDILVSRKTEIKTGKLFKVKLHKKGEGKIRIKKDMPTEKYGGYLNMETSYLSLIKLNNKKKMIGIPMNIANKCLCDKNELINYAIDHLDNKEAKVLIGSVPYNTLIIFKNHPVYVRGYSVQNKSCEVINGLQLKFKKEQLVKWKHALQRLLNDKNNYNKYPDSLYKENLIEILNELFAVKIKYPLFDKSVSKIEKQLNIDDLNIEDLEKIIIGLFIVYHCNSVNADLSKYNLGDRIGRLKGINISGGKIINTSCTGIKVSRY